jgi:hypothetical protein
MVLLSYLNALRVLAHFDFPVAYLSVSGKTRFLLQRQSIAFGSIGTGAIGIASVIDHLQLHAYCRSGTPSWNLDLLATPASPISRAIRQHLSIAMQMSVEQRLCE